MKNKLLPALIGGGSVFVASLLLALIPRAGYCTCLLAVFGGALAAYLYINKSTTPVRGGEGIIVGALAGIVTGLLRLAYLPINYMMNRENIETQLQRAEERLRQAGIDFSVNWPLFLVAGSLLAIVILAVLEAVGGAVGVALFEKRKGGTDETPPPPPPPTDFAALPGGDPGA